VEVKVGIQNVTHEVTIETEEAAADVERRLTDALASGGLVRLTDAKGRAVLIPASAIAYVDLGAEHVRPVGFGAV